MKKLVLIAAFAAAVAVIAVCARLVHVHDTYGEWRLTSTETPNRITALGRDYNRSESEPATSAPAGFVERGETNSGGTILAPKRSKVAIPVVIYVRDDDGQVWSYALVGGP